MAALRFVAATLLLTVAVARDLRDKSGSSLRTKALSGGASSGRSTKKILKQPEVEQQLVICNAYASPSFLDIDHVQTLDRLTGNAPLRYKECREFTMPLAEGDQLDFKAGNLDVGTFYATGLPKSSASLLLIPHRRDSHSVAISFESHAFADLQSPQIAVVDAYRGGNGEGSVKISDMLPEGSAIQPVEEMLKFSSVVAVNPGNYKVMLTGGASDTNSTDADPSTHVPLLVQNQAKYVVMRVGTDSTTGKGEKPYPQELVVFPQSGSLGLRLGLGSLVLCALASAFINLF